MKFRRMVLGALAVGALAVAGAAPASADSGAVPTVTKLTVAGNAGDYTYQLANGSSPDDVKVNLQATVTEYQGGDVQSGSVTFSRSDDGAVDGTAGGSGKWKANNQQLRECETTFTATYNGVDGRFQPSTSQSVTVTLVGGTCGTPVDVPEYENCDQVRAAGYTGGIAKATDPELYAANEHLDADNDGVACEADVPDGKDTDKGTDTTTDSASQVVYVVTAGTSPSFTG
jgi:hypothetical protein